MTRPPSVAVDLLTGSLIWSMDHSWADDAYVSHRRGNVVRHKKLVT